MVARVRRRAREEDVASVLLRVLPELHLGSRRVDDDGESPGARDRHVLLLHRSTASLRATRPSMATYSARPNGGRGPARYCTFAVTDVGAFRVRLQLLALAPPLEQPPDQMASRPLLTVSVTTVPVAKLALPVVPTLTLMPAGLEETDSPERPVAVTVS